MNEVKYPVIVRVGGQQSYQWLTLAQANERFIVVGGRLVINNVEPLVLNYAQFLLEQSQKSLADSQENFELLCEDIAHCKNSSRFVIEYLQPKLDRCKYDIEKAEFDIDFLTKAIGFLNS